MLLLVFQTYSYFKSHLHGALDHSAKFLTVLAGRTVKIFRDREVAGSNPGAASTFQIGLLLI